MLHCACATEYFPLTLTLSLREREQQASDWCLADGRWASSGMGVIERRRTLLPRPSGEGRGEGELSVAHPTGQSVSAQFWGLELRCCFVIRDSSFGFDQCISTSHVPMPPR